ncbi:MAG: TIGR03943 family putative permease subunit [Verrucomicrobiota bacterium]
MNAIASRICSAGILMIWGVVLLYFQISGRIASYLHPDFHIYAAASGVILVLLSIALLLTFPEKEAFCGCDHDHSSNPFSGGIAALVILTVPVLAATKISQSSFGVTTVMNRGLIGDIADLPGYSPAYDPGLPQADGSITEGTMMDPSLYLQKNESGQIVAQTVDLLYAAGDDDMRADFENKEVELIGQFLPSKNSNPSGDRFQLIRLFVMCCAADARPVAIPVQAPAGTTFPEMTWIRVTGKATFPVEGGRRTPLVLADSITETEPPRETFIY